MRIPQAFRIACLVAVGMLQSAGVQAGAPTVGLHLKEASSAASVPVDPESDAPAISLESLDGADTLEVHGADDRIRRVRQGGELLKGDSFVVPQAAAVRIAFEEGVQAMVASGSQVGIAREEGVPELRLDQGEVRSLVEPSASAKSGRKPLKFMIRTRTSALGVRGTDFVTEARTDWASVHTVDGTVEMGRDSDEIQRGLTVPVGARQFTEARPGAPIAHPSSYRVRDYLARFHQAHPRMARLYQAASRDRRSGRLRQRFRKIHQLRKKRPHPKRQHPKARSKSGPRKQKQGTPKQAHRKQPRKRRRSE